MRRFFVGMFVAGSIWCACGAAFAADATAEPAAKTNTDETWEYHPTTPSAPIYKPNPTAIVQQKSMIRAQQRQDRMAAQDWYGLSNSRPTQSPTPFFTSRSRFWWDKQNQRPYAWYESAQQPFNIRVVR
jgi:hypothetical protein